VVISKRVSWFLIAFGVWSWVIWPVFLKNIWKDRRSWHHGMTAFFGVHLALTVVSLVLGTIIGVLGIRAARQASVPSNPADRKDVMSAS
jgi:hypothetical protein